MRSRLVYAALFCLVAACSRESTREISVSTSSAVGKAARSADLTDHDDGRPGKTEELEDDRPSQQDVDDCASKLSTDAARILLTGNNDRFTVEANQSVAVKIDSNRPTVHLTIDSTQGATVSGVCVYLHGNKGNLTIDVKGAVDTLYYVADGNKSQGVIHVLDKAGLQSLLVHIDGNKSTLAIDGAGQFSCPTGEVDGNKSSLACAK